MKNMKFKKPDIGPISQQFFKTAQSARNKLGDPLTHKKVRDVSHALVIAARDELLLPVATASVLLAGMIGWGEYQHAPLSDNAIKQKEQKFPNAVSSFVLSVITERINAKLSTDTAQNRGTPLSQDPDAVGVGTAGSDHDWVTAYDAPEGDETANNNTIKPIFSFETGAKPTPKEQGIIKHEIVKRAFRQKAEQFKTEQDNRHALQRALKKYPSLQKYKDRITPEVLHGLARAAKEQAYPLDLLLLTVNKESHFLRNARNRYNDKVFGIFQLAKGGYLEQIYKNQEAFKRMGDQGAYLADSVGFAEREDGRSVYWIKKGYDKKKILAARDDPYIAATANILLSRDHMNIVRERAPVFRRQQATYADVYVVHLLGCGDAAHFYNQLHGREKNDPVENSLPQKVLKQNPSIFYDKQGQILSPAQVYKRLQNTFGTQKLSIAAPKKEHEPTTVALTTNAHLQGPAPAMALKRPDFCSTPQPQL